MADKEPEAVSQPTLKDRLGAALSQMENKKRAIPLSISPQFPVEFETDYCVICKRLRLDKDQTGITCGNLQCLAELGKSWGGVIAILKTMAERLGIDTKGLSLEDVSAMSEKIEGELADHEEIASDLENIGQILGIKTEDKNIKMLLEAIRAEVDALSQTVKVAEAQINVKS